MNEATLEARLHSELLRIFPTFGKLRISHQDTFTLHFGHKSITVNGKENDKVFGRYDVLIKIDERPVILFELKRPGKDLLDEDREQGISYARLLDPMPPLVVISNGEKSEFYTTYDKKPWIAERKDEEALRALVERGLSCAAAEKDEAVKLLLGQQPNIWTGIIRKFTEERIIARQGELKDLTYPLSKNFSLPRKLTAQIASRLLSGDQLIALVGPPLSGKTNVISQLCAGETKGLVFLYVDCSSLSYGILQHLSNIFARELFRASSDEEIKNWLLNGLRNPVNGRLVIIMDGWSLNVSDQIRADVESIIDICKNRAVSILIAIDDHSFSSIVSVPGRPTKTEIGQKIVKLSIEPLDDEEFDLSRQYFYENYKVIFHPGAQHNEVYHYPRVLRIIAAEVSSHKSAEGAGIFVPSVTSVDLLNLTWHHFAEDPTLRIDFKKLARGFVNDKQKRDSDPELSLASHGRGFVTYETAELELGNDRLMRLLSQGHLSLANYKLGNALIVPKVPELLASAASYFLAEEILTLLKQGRKDEAYKYLVNQSVSFPYGDIVAAIAIVEVTKQEAEFLSFIISELIQDPPRIEPPPKSFKGFIDVPNIGTLPIEDISEGVILENLHPWLILSHLANIAMAQNGSRELQVKLFEELGSFPEILRRPDSISSTIMKKFHVHELPGIGTILCHETGIVEPIMQAILKGFYEIPREMVELCKHAVKSEKWVLFWRLYTAAKAAETCIDATVAESSKEVIKMFDSFEHAVFDDTIIHGGTSLEAGEKKKPSRNKPCPCGSGLKYKKCCGKS